MNWLTNLIKDAIGVNEALGRPLPKNQTNEDTYASLGLKQPTVVERKLARLLDLSTSTAIADYCERRLKQFKTDPDRRGSIRCGEDYSIFRNDIGFHFHFRDTRPYSVAVSFDGVHVMRFSISDRMTITLKSDSLTKEIVKAADEILRLRAEDNAMRNLRDFQVALERADREDAVRKRFGAVKA